MPENSSPGPDLERFRGYLLFFAQLHWDKRLNGKLDPEDLVQQTLKEADQKWCQFEGTTEAELKAWLRRTLAHDLADAIRYWTAEIRNVNLEQSIADDMEGSSARLEKWLAADQSTPSERAAKHEQLERLIAAMAKLKPLYRGVVIRHHFQGLSLVELAGEMNRTVASVAGLLRRGLDKLRELMGSGE
jgi:RNA polymerase sigma-70 factor (ECF subfamily)